MLNEEETNYLNSLNGTSNITMSQILPNCSLQPTYFEFERIYYLAVMLPVAVIGVLTNIITFRVFSHKSFSSVTFKFMKLIAISDCFICVIVIPYCLTSYTEAFNELDMYFRNVYLAYIYLPVANILITISMFLNLLVSIERLASVCKYFSFFILLELVFNIYKFILSSIPDGQNIWKAISI